MADFLYNLFIMPIQAVISYVYVESRALLNNKGFAIVCVSLVVQLLVLPIYKRADALSLEERKKKESMQKWVSHIKKTFKGDEQFMLLNTYYRQQNYKVWYSLRSSFSVLLQIPFFLAAYNYLSNLSELQGQSFYFIADLGQPDMLIKIGVISINLLPILMTVINIISGMVYTENLSKKDRVQIVVLALVFLVLLYNSPSGLVLYWTMNNIFSLFKNIVMCSKIKINPSFGKAGEWFISLRDKIYATIDRHNIPDSCFVLEMIFMTVFMGILIPISVISSSAIEFIQEYSSLSLIIAHSFSVFAGYFIVWALIFYALMDTRLRRVFSVLGFGMIICALIDYVFYTSKFGTMSTSLVFDKEIMIEDMTMVTNLEVLSIVTLVLFYLVTRRDNILKNIMTVMVLSAVCFVMVNVVSVYNQSTHKTEISAQNAVHSTKVFDLSKNGKNVVVLMLDRAISGYLPFIFDEKPELLEAFSGFTYYPNTLSLGACTNYCTPSLFGGYEYTTYESDKRSDMSLKDKQNEALKVMPRIFADNDYLVTVADLPYANYSWNSDMSIFDGEKNISAYNTEGAYIQKEYEIFDAEIEDKKIDNFVGYALFRTLPSLSSYSAYNGGQYLGDSVLMGETGFMNSFTALYAYPEITNIIDDDNNRALFLCNNMTHELHLFELPDYEVPAKDLRFEEEIQKIESKRVLNDIRFVIKDADDLTHYETNMAAMILLAKWFDYLRENDVYDNTRIIVVADHGRDLRQFTHMHISEDINVEIYNPLLLVKDFGDTEFRTSDEFMTNADVPTIAMEGLIDNPVNPFTGKVVNNDEKYAHPQYLNTAFKWSTSEPDRTQFDLTDGKWFSVKDNIFDRNNWEEIEIDY